jgi:hypothetical protein
MNVAVLHSMFRQHQFSLLCLLFITSVYLFIYIWGIYIVVQYDLMYFLIVISVLYLTES